MLSLLPACFPSSYISSSSLARTTFLTLLPFTTTTSRKVKAPTFRLSSTMSASPTATATTIDTTTPDAVAPVTGEEVDGSGEVVVQYVVLRRDLIDKWPLGSIVAQGCHAAVAAVWAHRDHPDTAAYVAPANIDSMHKVTLEVKGEAQMRSLAEKLAAGGVEHKVWIEQPENIATCIATRPYRRSEVAAYFKKLRLCK